MARLLEDDSKKLLATVGVAVPEYRRVASPQEAEDFCSELGKPVIVKALVPVGGRQKLGAVRIAYSPREAALATEALLGSKVGGFPVDKVLVEEKIEISKELYVSFTNDVLTRRQAVITSAKGGVDIEEVDRTASDSIIKYDIDPILGFEFFQARRLWLQLGFRGELLLQLADITRKLFELYHRLDSFLLEVNPLAITPDQKIIAVSCVMEIDDDALFRHPELFDKVLIGLDRIWRPLTEREREVILADLQDPYRGTIRYTEFDTGDIGFLCGGGGASLVLQDAIKAAGGKTANYSEWGGNPSEQKLEILTKAVVSKPGVKGLLICLNISNNTRTDIAAKGIVKALRESNVKDKGMPVVIRLAGLNDQQAKVVIEEAGYEYHGEDMTMEEAAWLIVRLIKAREMD